MSLSARRAWIEIDEQIEQEFVPESLSARRAWIEIIPAVFHQSRKGVALRKESVDRNVNSHSSARRKTVALRKESVDRNKFTPAKMSSDRKVALRKESVDRNNIERIK